ncbi:hypothetical protein AO738_08030 [Pseudomonas citronellolis]|nr:hypothetical protein AO742_07325 [Pseudomonas citronellolis]KRW78232.1 hypothetical protein AO738_08030 [Pseudomonas citronellolis]
MLVPITSRFIFHICMTPEEIICIYIQALFDVYRIPCTDLYASLLTEFIHHRIERDLNAPI